MANDPVSSALASAKTALAHSNAAFPPSKPATTAPAKAAPKAAAPSMADELKAKGDMVGKARQAMAAPKMHSGGPVSTDGIYQLKAGEHVLTASEAKIAKKHAMMMTGLKSLAKEDKQKK